MAAQLPVDGRCLTSGSSRSAAAGQRVLPRPAQRLSRGRARRQARTVGSLSNGADQGTVVSLGEALFDCLANQRGVPKEEVKSWTPYPGGAPANVATAVARLGVKVAFVGALGHDGLAQKMLDLLQERGVDCAGVQRVERPTRDVLVVFDDHGDRRFVGFGSANTEFADTVIAAEALPLGLLGRAKALITGTLGLAFPVTAEAMHRAVDAARAGPAVVLIDVNWRPVFWEDPDHAKDAIMPYLGKADIVKVSDEEVEWLLGVPAADALFNPEKVLGELPGAKGVLVTAGGQGCSYAFKAAGGKMDYTGLVPVLQVKVEDTTGAGDAFLGGFVASLVKMGGLEALQADADKLRRAVEFAAACGAFTTTKPGAIDAQPTLEEAEKLLSSSSFAPAPVA